MSERKFGEVYEASNGWTIHGLQWALGWPNTWYNQENAEFCAKSIRRDYEALLNAETAPLHEALQQEKKAHAYDIEQARLGFEVHEAMHKEKDKRIAELEAALQEIVDLDTEYSPENGHELGGFQLLAKIIAKKALAKKAGDNE